MVPPHGNESPHPDLPQPPPDHDPGLPPGDRTRGPARDRTASIYRGTEVLAAFPVTLGPARLIPRGSWEILNMVTTPTFLWDKRMLKEGRRSKHYHMLPPGPNNPVGIFWAGINKRGIGLHGTNSPRTIGRSTSAGCIRFANWDAIRLPKFLRPGSEVIIR